MNINPSFPIDGFKNKKLQAPQLKYGFHNHLRGIGKLTYPIRVFSAAMFSFIILAHNSNQDISSDYAIVIAISLFFWPHISVLAYKYFNSNKKAEFFSQILDCFFAGSVAYITEFSLVPSFVVITLTLASGMALNGIKQFSLGILGVAAGIVIPGLFMGFTFESSDSLVVTILGLGLLFIFFNYFAYMAYSRSVLLKDALKSIKDQKEELEKEKKKSDALLLNILPYETAAELKKSGKAYPKSYEHVTVLFTDFQKFTNIAEKLSPAELVAEIDHCFKEFDRIVTNYNIEKIKTIGDAYLCVCGLPSPNKNHAVDIVSAAIEIQEFLENLKKERQKQGKFFFEARIGIHTGPVVAGIVGIKKFAYDIWGDTVNTASRMESSGEVGKVNISHDTFLLIKENFNCIPRGKIDAKHKGEVDMYFVEKKFEPSINMENFENAKEYILTRLKKELADDLTYHGYHHTMDVYHSVIRIAHNENINGEDLMLLKTAALYHDAGFIYQYKDHENVGCELVKEVLPKFNYTHEQIEKVCGMIMATKIPQSPNNHLEQVICDADLDYLGRDDFFEIGDTLYEEFKWQHVIKDEIQWNKLQLDFLSKHHYFTSSVIEQRNIRKHQHLEEIRKRVEG